MGGGHTRTAKETAPDGQPGLAGKTRCVVIPSAHPFCHTLVFFGYTIIPGIQAVGFTLYLGLSPLGGCGPAPLGVLDTQHDPLRGKAASPWQAICTVEHDNLMGPPSRGDRLQSRVAPGGLAGPSRTVVGGTRLSLGGGLLPAAGSRGSQPTHPILQPSTDATPSG